MNLLDTLTLSTLQPVKLAAELLQSVVHGDLQASVEFRMTPMIIAGDDGTPSFQVACELRCRVNVTEGERRKDVLVIEHHAKAVYAVRPGAAMSEAHFRARHADLGRQLYPLMQQRIAPLFALFGVAEIRLPLEVVPDTTSAPSGATH